MMQLQSGQNIKISGTTLRLSMQFKKITGFTSDIDPSAFILSANGKVRGDNDFIFFNQPSTSNGSLVLQVMDGSCTFTVDLNKLDSDISKIAMTLVIDGSDSVANLSELIFNADGLATFNVDVRGRSEKALIVAEIYRHNNEWKLRALGQGFSGGLAPLAINYGVDVAPTPVETIPQAVATTVSIEKKIQTQAPRLVSLAKTATVSLVKHNLQSIKAQVAFVLDASGSMSTQFSKGYVQAVLDRIAVLSVQFDDDGSMDMWGFASKHRKFKSVTLQNLDNYVTTIQKDGKKGWLEILPALGCANNEPPVMKEIVETFKDSKLPVFVIFITDGGIDKDREIKRIIKESANYPIFWKFVGLGGHSYGILEDLDDFTDRIVDNSNFFAIDNFDKMKDDVLYDLLLVEFKEWHNNAIRLGIIR